MNRALLFAGATLGVLLIGGFSLFLWASSGSLPEQELSELKSYPTPPASPNRDTFTVMTYDLNHLSGRDSHDESGSSTARLRSRMNGTINLVREADPHFLGLQDVSFDSHGSEGVQQLDTLAHRLRFANGAQAVSWNETYVPSLLASKTGRSGSIVSGQGLLSRFRFRRHMRKELPSPRHAMIWNAFSPSPVVQIAVADIGGWPLVLINVSLEASEVEAREKQARRVNSIYKSLARYGFPILLFGNLNSVWPSAVSNLPPEAQKRFAEDETLQLLVKGTSLTPAFSEGAYVSGTSLNTYPASDPTLKLDYIFYRPRQIVPTSAEVRCGSPPPSSHCAVTMSFLLPRPKEKLPDKRIPDDQLPTLDSLLNSAGIR